MATYSAALYLIATGWAAPASAASTLSGVFRAGAPG